MIYFCISATHRTCPITHLLLFASYWLALGAEKCWSLFFPSFLATQIYTALTRHWSSSNNKKYRSCIKERDASKRWLSLLPHSPKSPEVEHSGNISSARWLSRRAGVLETGVIVFFFFRAHIFWVKSSSRVILSLHILLRNCDSTLRVITYQKGKPVADRLANQS